MNLNNLSPNEKKIVSAVQSGSTVSEAVKSTGVAASQYYTAIKKLSGRIARKSSKRGRPAKTSNYTSRNTNFGNANNSRNDLSASITTRNGVTVNLAGNPATVAETLRNLLN